MLGVRHPLKSDEIIFLSKPRDKLNWFISGAPEAKEIIVAKTRVSDAETPVSLH